MSSTYENHPDRTAWPDEAPRPTDVPIEPEEDTDHPISDEEAKENRERESPA